MLLILLQIRQYFLTTHVGTVKSYDSDKQQLNTTFENTIKFDLEQSSNFNIPQVQEGHSSALNENNILAEDVQIEETDDDDNIILRCNKVIQLRQLNLFVLM